VGFRTQGRSAWSKNIINIIRTSLKEAAARLKYVSVKSL
jgi:hypothetical protein